MTETVTIYGHDIELDEPDSDGVVTDVIILYRTVYPATHRDRVDIIPSSNTTGVTLAGMLTIAQTYDLARWTGQGEYGDD